MTDDIIDRLRCAYRKGEEPPCEACTFCAARAEIERLRAAGDALEVALSNQPYTGILVRDVLAALAAWREARRG